MLKNRKHLPINTHISTTDVPIKTTQFGVGLQFIKDNNNGDVIPPIVKQCIEFLDTPESKLKININLILNIFNLYPCTHWLQY